MYKLILFFLTTIFFIGCSSDNATSTGASIDDIYYTPTGGDCSLAKLNTAPAPTSIPMLVVLINYNNISITSPISTWKTKMFGNSEGELNHYYDEISNSNFTFTKTYELDGIASVNLNKDHPNSNIDLNSFDNDVYPDFTLALQALDNNISFNTYDTNLDGHIQANELLITFIMAGYEDAYEGSHITNGVWAHQSCTDSSLTPVLDGVSLMGCNNNGNFAIFGELHYDSQFETSPHDATIGIIAHELGHSAFNLPDLYYGNGIGAFGLMGAGTWAYANPSEDAGQTPVHMSAWSKFYKGWVIPDNTKGGKVMNATSLNSYNTVIIEGYDKCYLVENRDNSGYDRGLFMLNGTFNGGIAIWEVDYKRTEETYITTNSVNGFINGVSILDAQGGYVYNTSAGDEDALFYDGNINNLGTVITNISIRGQTMTLDIN